jgi:hypothetical protein
MLKLALTVATLVAALVALPACKSTPPADAWDSFGDGVAAGSVLSVDDLLDSPADWDGKTVVVEAEVDAVCQMKGCWMTFTSNDDKVRISFKDYGFFVPMDLGGRTVRVEGIFAITEVSVDEARHYLEDEGRHEEALAITEPERTYEIVATGVIAAPAS